MSMDKSWIMIKNRKSPAYMNGVKDFIEHEVNFVDSSGKLQCPCKKCVNMSFERISVVRVHLLQNGFHQFYTEWIFHSEPFQNPINDEPQVEENVDMKDILNDFMESDDGGNGGDGVDERATGSNQYFNDLFTETKTELYPGCTKFSSLNFLVKLMHLKVTNKWINKSFDSLLKLLKDALSEGE